MTVSKVVNICSGKNPMIADLSSVPEVACNSLDSTLGSLDPAFERVASMFAVQEGKRRFRIFVVFANEANGRLSVVSCPVGEEYQSFTRICPQVHLFEREIHEQFGIMPVGHPWLKPVRFENRPLGTNKESETVCGDTDYFSVKGSEIHEVAVGPIHAGVIEPGHFRFQCYGERVFHLEISLGYQHRGIERALVGGPDATTLFQIETIAGDTSVGHTLAYCQLLEALFDIKVSLRAEMIRAVALELERLANHIGDLGALASDVGFLPTSSYCGRIRGDFLNMTALICGSRLGRGLLVPGGVRFDVDSKERLGKLSSALEKGKKDLDVAVNLLWERPTVMARFENTGAVSYATCNDLGLVGPAARASGSVRDVRSDFPYGYYRREMVGPASGAARSGCVLDRAQVRWEEIQKSIEFVQRTLKNLPGGERTSTPAEDLPSGLPGNKIAVSLTEGWRGEICHVALTDSEGKFAHYKVVDPSFHNWSGLAMALRNEEISDFPLCNKSFNLSYCGFDL